MRIVGLTDKAIVKIEELEAYPVPIEPDRTGADDIVPLNKYVWLHPTTKETLQWIDHVIADLQDRKVKLLNDPNSTGEYFREYVQDTNLDEHGAVVFLSLMHSPDDMDPVQYASIIKIREYDWTDQGIMERSGEEDDDDLD